MQGETCSSNTQKGWRSNGHTGREKTIQAEMAGRFLFKVAATVLRFSDEAPDQELSYECEFC